MIILSDRKRSTISGPCMCLSGILKTFQGSRPATDASLHIIYKLKIFVILRLLPFGTPQRWPFSKVPIQQFY